MRNGNFLLTYLLSLLRTLTTVSRGDSRQAVIKPGTCDQLREEISLVAHDDISPTQKK